jgi:hypothetical protein
VVVVVVVVGGGDGGLKSLAARGATCITAPE